MYASQLCTAEYAPDPPEGKSGIEYLCIVARILEVPLCQSELPWFLEDISPAVLKNGKNGEMRKKPMCF